MATTTPPTVPSAAPLGVQRQPSASPTARELAFNIAVWILFTAFWVAVFAALVFSQGTLDDTWHKLRALPLIFQGVVWLLLLPLTTGLAIWETPWHVVVRLVLIAGLAGFNIYLFFPCKGATR